MVQLCKLAKYLELKPPSFKTVKFHMLYSFL